MMKRLKLQRNTRLVISYLRYSSSAQTNGDSIRRQLAASEKWATDRGLIIDESLKDEGVSAFRGTNAESGALGSILRRIERGDIPTGSVIIVESLDRLSRQQVRKALSQFLQIIEAGVTIVTLTDNREYSPEKCDELELIQSLMIMSRAHEESATKSYRSKENWSRRRSLAKSGEMLSTKVPSWIDVEDGKMILNKQKVAIVRRIFDLAIKGHGVGSIVRKLNEEGVQPFTAEKAKAGRGGAAKQWYTRFVWRMLTDGAVIGLKELKKIEGKKRVTVEKIDNYYPAAVSVEQFRKANAMMSTRKNYQGTRVGGGTSRLHNMFNGILKDDKGNGFTSFLRKKAGIRYLVPLSAISKAAGPWHYLRQDIFEKAFLETFVGVFHDDYLGLFKSKKATPQTDAMHGELQKIETQIEKLTEKLVALDDPTPIVAAIEKLTKRQRDLEKEIRASGQTAILTNDDAWDYSMERFGDILSGSLSNDERIEMSGLLRRLVSDVRLSLSKDGEKLVGAVTVYPRVGKAFSFTFSYNNSRFIPQTKKAATLVLTEPKLSKAA